MSLGSVNCFVSNYETPCGICTVTSSVSAMNFVCSGEIRMWELEESLIKVSNIPSIISTGNVNKSLLRLKC